MSGEQFLPSRDATGDALEKLAGSGQLCSSREMTKMSAGSGEQFSPNGDERVFIHRGRHHGRSRQGIIVAPR